ncbi:MAG: flavin reductase family protein [Bacteroidota bacterium]
MNKKEFDLKGPDVMKLAWLMSNGQIVMLTCTNREKTINGIITLGWCNPISFEPFLIIASIGSGGKETGDRAYRYCYTLINETKEFGINIPTPDLKEAIAKVGTTHSNEVDKFNDTGLTKMPSSKIKAPMINECFLNVECKVLEQFVTGDHTVFVAEPVAAFMNEDAIVEGKFSDKYYDKKNQLQLDEFITMWDMW